MTNADQALQGRRVLVVEDEFLIAEMLSRDLQDAGAVVIGPASDLASAMGLLKAGLAMDAAVLDVNLGGEPVYPLADALEARGVPFVFATGYDVWALPERFAGVPRCEKPIDLRALLRALGG